MAPVSGGDDEGNFWLHSRSKTPVFIFIEPELPRLGPALSISFQIRWIYVLLVFTFTAVIALNW